MPAEARLRFHALRPCLGVAGEHRVVATQDLEGMQDEIVASAARRIAEDVFLGDAMAAAIYGADPQCGLAGMSSHSPTCTVTLDGDVDGKVAKRLPRWIEVEVDEAGPVRR
jgi:hypothetical protein